jgi:hypothetical protein
MTGGSALALRRLAQRHPWRPKSSCSYFNGFLPDDATRATLNAAARDLSPQADVRCHLSGRPQRNDCLPLPIMVSAPVHNQKGDGTMAEIPMAHIGENAPAKGESIAFA